MRPASRKDGPLQTVPLTPSAEPEATARRQKRRPDEPSQAAVALVLVYRTLSQLLPENYDPDRRSLR